MELHKNWIKTAIEELETGDSINIPVPTRIDRTTFLRELREERDAIARLDPEQALKIKIYGDVKEGRQWAVLVKVADSGMLGVIKRADGTMRKIRVQDFEERSNILTKMILDARTRSEIVDAIGELSEDEEILLGG